MDNDSSNNTPSTPELEEGAYRKVVTRLVPFLFLCYVVAYLDRVNVGFAKLQMLNDLKFSETVYGLGAGIFFIGYFIFEVPSNLLLHRVGARVWIARIMITWGIVSACTMFVTTPTMFYVMRFILGVAEAGFFPGIILYLTYWFPARRRARVIALFMSAIAVSGVVGGPVSGWIMETFDQVGGHAGWQWLFVLEGIPSVLVGLVVLGYLDDSIAKARWLRDEEKRLLQANIAAENAVKEDAGIGSVFGNPRVIMMAALYFCLVMGLYGVSFWLPQLIKQTGVKDVLTIGLLTAIPYAVAVVAMVLASRSSDRSGERRWHTALAALAGAAGMLMTAWAGDSTVMGMVALSIGTAGIVTALPLFWSLPTEYLGGAAAAAGIAVINSLGNLAGFVSPYAVGALKDATGSTAMGLYLITASLVLGAVLALASRRPSEEFRQAEAARGVRATAS